jgi:hypothetical protein
MYKPYFLTYDHLNFRLGDISPEEKITSQNFTVRDRLGNVCTKIAEDIKACGNLCDAYLKKRLIGVV